MSTRPAMTYREYRAYDAVGLAGLVRAGEVSAAGLLATAVERARAVDPRLGFMARWMTGIAAERAAGPLSGPLAGVPFLVKDLAQDYRGVPTSRGSAAWRDRPADGHSDVVRRWLDAGLVVFGKTTTPEFGAKSTTEPLAFGPARNPWAPDRTAGGSSGGSSVAVAAGVVPAAGASDGGGSIRVPASCCGLFGLKPTRGLVPAGPVRAELMHGATTHGVVSRSVRDTAALLDCLVRRTRSYLEHLDASLPRLRVGYTTTSFRGVPADPAAAGAVHRAATLLTGLGHAAEAADPGVDGDQLAADFLTVWFGRIAASAAATRAVIGSERGLEPETRIAAALGRGVSAADYVAAHDRWHRHTRALAAFHERYDLLLTPTLARAPVPLGSLDLPGPLRAGGELVRRLGLGRPVVRSGVLDRISRGHLGWAPFTQLANVTGACAVTVPVHRTPDGLPVGAQLVAPPGQDDLLLRVGAALESVCRWQHDEPPPVAAGHPVHGRS